MAQTLWLQRAPRRSSSTAAGSAAPILRRQSGARPLGPLGRQPLAWAPAPSHVGTCRGAANRQKAAAGARLRSDRVCASGAAESRMLVRNCPDRGCHGSVPVSSAGGCGGGRHAAARQQAAQRRPVFVCVRASAGAGPGVRHHKTTPQCGSVSHGRACCLTRDRPHSAQGAASGGRRRSALPLGHQRGAKRGPRRQ